MKIGVLLGFIFFLAIFSAYSVFAINTLTVGWQNNAYGSVNTTILSGTVVGGGGACGPTSCTYSYNFNNTGSARLQATTFQNGVFSGWSGACSGTNPVCIVNVTMNRTVQATFVVQNSTIVSGCSYINRTIWERAQQLDVNGTVIYREGQPVYRGQYVILPDGLFSVDAIYNASSGYADDYVELRDVFSQMNYFAQAYAEGFASITLRGNTYGIRYFGAATMPQEQRYILIDFPQTNNLTIMAFENCIFPQINQTHLACVNSMCSLVNGSGTNTCSPVGMPCNITNQTHLACIKNTCRVVAGGGPNQNGCRYVNQTCAGATKPTNNTNLTGIRLSPEPRGNAWGWWCNRLGLFCAKAERVNARAAEEASS